MLQIFLSIYTGMLQIFISSLKESLAFFNELQERNILVFFC